MNPTQGQNKEKLNFELFRTCTPGPGVLSLHKFWTSINWVGLGSPLTRMHWSSIIFFYILKNFYRCTSCLLAHHLTYIVVYIVFLLFEKIAHYMLVLYARFLRENARTALITKTVWWMLNEWEILQCKLILRKKIQKGGAWIISEGEVVLIHTIVSK